MMYKKALQLYQNNKYEAVIQLLDQISKPRQHHYFLKGLCEVQLLQHLDALGSLSNEVLLYGSTEAKDLLATLKHELNQRIKNPLHVSIINPKKPVITNCVNKGRYDNEEDYQKFLAHINKKIDLWHQQKTVPLLLEIISEYPVFFPQSFFEKAPYTLLINDIVQKYFDSGFLETVCLLIPLYEDQILQSEQLLILYLNTLLYTDNKKMLITILNRYKSRLSKHTYQSFNDYA